VAYFEDEDNVDEEDDNDDDDLVLHKYCMRNATVKLRLINEELVAAALREGTR
jgi:hypothetical protein